MTTDKCPKGMRQHTRNRPATSSMLGRLNPCSWHQLPTRLIRSKASSISFWAATRLWKEWVVMLKNKLLAIRDTFVTCTLNGLGKVFTFKNWTRIKGTSPKPTPMKKSRASASTTLILSRGVRMPWGRTRAQACTKWSSHRNDSCHSPARKPISRPLSSRSGSASTMARRTVSLQNTSGETRLRSPSSVRL